MLLILYKYTDDRVFDDFPKISYHFPKIYEDFSKLTRRAFPNISRTFPKIAEDFRGTLEDVSITHQRIQVQTCPGYPIDGNR